MPEYFYIVFTLYYIFVLLMWYGWGRIRAPFTPSDEVPHFTVSVVIAVRHEAKNISNLIDDLAKQTLPPQQFEVIIVDDHSEDSTLEIARKSLNFHENLNGKVILSETHDGTAPKKAALQTGIAQAKGSIIALTDGDCRTGEAWLESMTAPFADEHIRFVSGPVVIHEKKGIFSWIQSLEFASLMGTGAALIGLGYPLMCNGANLAFRKKVFDEVNGYEGVKQHATGDDVFLMQKIHEKYPGSVHFVKDKKAIVTTAPAASLRQFIAQRKRWASKWNRHLLRGSSLLPVFLFVFYLSFITALIIPFFHEKMMIPVINIVIVKVALDYFFLRDVMRFGGLRMRIWLFLTAEILYPFYALFFGIIVHLSGWRWKGRRFKS